MSLSQRVSALALVSILATSSLAALSSPVQGEQLATTSRISIPTSDGTHLAGELILPDDGKRFPVLLNMTPYGPATYFSTYTGQGYAHVNVDIRGTGASEGKLCLFCDREQKDVYDVVEWIARQKWSNGKVGMYGGSYQGITPLMGASEQPPHLEAIVPAVVLADAYRDIVWHNGVFNANFVAQWTALQFGLGLTGAQPGTDLSERPQQRLAAEARLIPWDGPFYKERSVYTKFDDIKVPTLFLGGWFDGFSRGTIDDFVGIASKHKRLVMQPCTHKGCGAPFDAGSEYTEDAAIPGLEDPVLAWMDHFLKGKDNDVEDGPPVLYYDLGAKRWLEAGTWPPRDTRITDLYLSKKASGSNGSVGDGSLVGKPSRTDDVESRFVYDPTIGVTETFSKWGTVAASPHLRLDNRPDQARSLTFTTPELGEKLILAGPMELHFWGLTTATNVDWVAKVTDVAPDGSASLLTSGFVRASHRAWSPAKSRPGRPWLPNDRESNVPAGMPLEYRVDIWDIAHTLAKGHRLRLTISSSDAPNHEPLTEPAINAVLHSKHFPSRLVVTER
jgi:uncharacterized protein